jgi:hypothetical protein
MLGRESVQSPIRLVEGSRIFSEKRGVRFPHRMIDPSLSQM